ncbi:MAG: sigma-70 family RNA polymerase sigma factor [Actinomycetota bacterium]|nr:sigma-70 family RNA polymerase sigma factor [Actinomycetota bacterium]
MTEARRSSPDERAAAFDSYVVPHLEVMYRVALSLTREPPDAEDLVQDAVLRAYRAIDRFDGRYPRAWLLTIVRNTHYNRMRRRTPFLFRDGESAEAALGSLGDHEPSAESVVVDPQLEAVVAEALNALPEKFRAPVDLVDIHGLTYQETADALGIPIGTVMSRLHRARRRIRTQLDTVGFVPGKEMA